MIDEQERERKIIADAVRESRIEGMRVLIAIVSCGRDRHTHQLIRETWLKDCPVDYKFFVGRDAISGDGWDQDEIPVNARDDWDALPAKVQEVCKYARFQGYDFIFKCDTDSYISVARLLASGFEKYHYSGCCGEQENVYPDSCFPANGGGYWLSRLAFEYLADHMNLGLGRNCEDWCVFLSLMKGAGIFVHHDPRYASNRPNPGQAPSSVNDFILLHDAGDRCLRNPDYMRAAHAAAGR